MKQTLVFALLLPLAATAQTPPAKAPATGRKTIVTVSASTPELPRKSEGDVIELKDGKLLLISMEFGGDGNDFATTRLVACSARPRTTRPTSKSSSGNYRLADKPVSAQSLQVP